MAYDSKKLKKETEVFYFKAFGRGGQRANKKNTGVRIHHLPSDIWVKATDTRFQAQNLKIAFERLREKLKKKYRPRKKRFPTRVPFWAEEKRIKRKKYRSQKKRLRRKPILE